MKNFVALSLMLWAGLVSAAEPLTYEELFPACPKVPAFVVINDVPYEMEGGVFVINYGTQPYIVTDEANGWGMLTGYRCESSDTLELQTDRTVSPVDPRLTGYVDFDAQPLPLFTDGFE